jgi:nucleoside-diphosphate-sugar epimerase
MKKVLILGHRGYLGSNLISFLKENKITTFIHPKKIFFKKFSYFNKVDYIVNCIGENYDENKMHESNYLVIKKIVNKINSQKKKPTLLHISSCSVYGGLFTVPNIIITESSKTHPISFYSKTKIKADNYIKSFLRSNYYILRPSQILSNNMKSNNYNNLVYFVKRGFFFYINNKDSFRNYIHLNDLLEFIFLLIVKENKIKNKIFIISRFIPLFSIIKFIKKSYNLKKFDFVIPKKFVLILLFFFKFFFPIKKISLNYNSISGLSASAKIKSNVSLIKHFKFKFHIIHHYLKYVCK